MSRTLKDYLKAKYPNGSIGMTQAEALVLGIAYPLESGWAEEHGAVCIDDQKWEFLENLSRMSRRQRNSAAVAWKWKAGKEVQILSMKDVSPKAKPFPRKFYLQISFDGFKGGFSHHFVDDYIHKDCVVADSILAYDYNAAERQLRKRFKKTQRKEKRQSKPKAEPSFYNSRAWRTLRYQALCMYGGKCQCCGATAETAILHVDHIKPRSKHPELELEITNLQVLCETCNMGKSNRDSTDWRPVANEWTPEIRGAYERFQ